MNNIKELKSKAAKLHRKALDLRKLYQAKMDEHSSWLHSDPERWEALLSRSLNAADAIKHKEFEEVTEELRVNYGKAYSVWIEARHDFRIASA